MMCKNRRTSSIKFDCSSFGPAFNVVLPETHGTGLKLVQWYLAFDKICLAFLPNEKLQKLTGRINHHKAYFITHVVPSQTLAVIIYYTI